MNLLAISALHNIKATAPSAGEQNINFVRGSETIIPFNISSFETGSLLHALGFNEPLLNAFSATKANASEVIP